MVMLVILFIAQLKIKDKVIFYKECVIPKQSIREKCTNFTETFISTVKLMVECY